MNWKLISPALGVVLAISMVLIANPAAKAADVPEGTIIEASNWEEMKDKTFEGRRIGDMVAEVYQMLLKEHSLKIRLAPSKPWPEEQRLIDLTKQYSAQTTLSPDGRVQNYVAGIPFPNVTKDDPDGGLKVLYNLVYSAFLGDVLDWPYFPFIVVNQNGYERTIMYKFALYQMIGRRSDGPGNHTEGDGSIRSLTTLIAIEPVDVRGLGTFAVRYVDGRYDDVYAYLRAVRRWRRLSGSAWFDPVQGSDFLNDETSNAFNADPGWYDGFKIVDRKTMLFPETENVVYFYPQEKEISRRMPYHDLQNPPYWNSKDEKEYWRPRDVWVIDATPPDGHPMSRRRLYVDTTYYFPLAFFVPAYDRAGDLWHIYSNSVSRTLTMDGYPTLNPSFGRSIDIKNLSATMLASGPGNKVNPPGVSADDYNLSAITRLLQ